MKKNSDWEEYLKKPRVQFIYIHHLFKDEEAKLNRLLDALALHHQFISYTEAWNRIISGNIDRPYIAFSSDDGLKNNLATAQVLKNYGASACFFICPDIVGEKSYEKLKSFSKNKLHFPPVEFLGWDEVATLQKQGHEIGSHTMSHINVAKTPEVDLPHEIGESYGVIESKCGAVSHFAYPYGRYFHFNELGKKEVFHAGFKSCASAERGCHIAPPGGQVNQQDLLIRRDHVIVDWPLEHILYFIVRNSKQADPANNFFPKYEDRHPD